MLDVKIEDYIRQGKTKLHSSINKYFNKDCLCELDLLCMNTSIDNNSKIKACNDILRKYNIPFSELGGGTNRYGIMIDGYCYKIAMDTDGKTDNKREFIYTKQAQPYVIKVYECEYHGLVMVCEYVQVFTRDDFYHYQKEMREICKELSKIFFIGDIGIDSKNYYNWGFRSNDDLVILDFAYIYKQSFKTISCPCGSLELLSYDKDYNVLICPVCGRKNTFWELRKRITRAQETAEIGDIREKGYVINDFKVDDVVKLNEKFTDIPKYLKPKQKKEKQVINKVPKEKFDDKLFLEEVDKLMNNGG